jgi:hypothetical protein
MKLPEEGIHVIENCIPKNLQDAIEEFYFSDRYVWLEKTGKHQDLISGKKLTTGLSRIKIEDGLVCNPLELELFEPVLKNSLEQIEVSYTSEKIILGRVLMQEPKENNFRNNVHVDTDKKCYTLLYYVNDSDGDTLFFDKTTKDYPYSEYNTSRFLPDWSERQKEIFTEIVYSKTPKKGTAVAFDGSIYHASSSPTLGRRCIINFCYEWS